MKKFLACMLCGCMAASLLTGCGGGDSSNAPAPDSGDSGAAEAPEAPAADAGDSESEAPAADAGTSGGGSDTINVWVGQFKDTLHRFKISMPVKVRF